MSPEQEEKIESWRNDKRDNFKRYPLYVITLSGYQEMIQRNKGRRNCISYKEFYSERIEELRNERDKARRAL